MTDDEFKAQYHSCLLINTEYLGVVSFNVTALNSIDWRDEGEALSVKNQRNIEVAGHLVVQMKFSMQNCPLDSDINFLSLDCCHVMSKCYQIRYENRSWFPNIN